MEQNTDRISALHDSLIGHILSFLPTKNAVRTSVLSQRWKDLWLLQTSISFDDNDLTDDDHTSTTRLDNRSEGSNRSVRTKRFINVVDKLLLNRDHGKPVIKTLQLSCREGVGASKFARWFGAVLRDGLQELDLKFGRYCKKPLSCLVPCNSLVTLKMDFGAFSGQKFTESFYFPNLKTMHLRGFVLANSFTNQLMTCRNLENLILYYFMFDTSLLTVQDDQNIASGYDHQQALPNLNNARVNCPSAFRGVNSVRLFMRNLITLLSKAKVLDLSLSVMEYLCIEPNFPDPMPKFNNLKHLKICLQAHQIGVMNYLLQMIPNMESLHIEFPQPYGHHDEMMLEQLSLQTTPNLEPLHIEFPQPYGPDDELMLEQLRSSCSWASLKVIRVSHLNPENDLHMELVRLFFENAGFLEKIITELDLDEIAATNPSLQCQKLLELPRLSTSCVLDVKWDNGSRTFNLCN